MRNRQLDIRNRFDLRLIFFHAALFGCFALLVANVVRLQWFEHERYQLRSDENRLNVVPVLPLRGEIVDVEGRGLAVNHIGYRVSLIPGRVTNLDETLQTLATRLGWSAGRVARLKRRIARARPDRPVLLDDKLRWDEVAPIVSHLHRLVGVDVQAGSYRRYPFAALTSHLIGYLSLARKRDRKSGV